MQIDFYFIAKGLLLFYIWTLIAFCVLFILKSKKVYLYLKRLEKNCVDKKREWAKNNYTLKTVLNLVKNSLESLLLSTFPVFFQGIVFYKWAKTSLNLTRKALR